MTKRQLKEKIIVQSILAKLSNSFLGREVVQTDITKLNFDTDSYHRLELKQNYKELNLARPPEKTPLSIYIIKTFSFSYSNDTNFLLHIDLNAVTRVLLFDSETLDGPYKGHYHLSASEIDNNIKKLDSLLTNIIVNLS